ncbi:MAG TPA: hypothetical protein VM431_13570, partial [Phycisphaerae bacterium]|nr:hypothetical protein [Phycisphaerae bacterium]
PEKASACAERIVAVCEARYARARGTAKAEAGESLIESLSALAEAELAAGEPGKAAATLRRGKAIALATGSDQRDAIAARLIDLAHLVKVDRQVTNMKALLDRDPENTAAREELVRLYLVDLDNPAQAAKHLEGTKDASLAKYVPAATRGVEAAPELACTELGDWYRGLGDAADDAAKPAMFARAQAYYERFLALHEAEDLKRTAAVLALKRVEDALAKLPAPKAAPTRWIDLLKLVDPAKDAVAGAWVRRGEGLAVSPAENCRLMLPVAVAGSYELDVTFTRVGGKDSISAILPVGDAAVLLILGGWRNTVAGLAMIEGKNVDNNGAQVKNCTLENGRTYRLQAKVTVRDREAEIVAVLDGRPLLTWSGPWSGLSLSPTWRLPVRATPGLMANDVAVVFRSARLRMVSGEAKWLRPEGGGKATPAPAAPTPGLGAKPGQWADLLAGANPAQDAVQGAWTRKDGGLTVAPSHCARTLLPGAPGDAYELEVAFVRTEGKGDVAFYLPAGQGKGCWLLFDMHSGSASGLDLLAGKRGEANETTVQGPTLTTGKAHTVAIQVRAGGDQVAIAVVLDRRPFTSWQGPASALSTHSSWSLPRADQVAVGADKTTVRFGRVRLRPLAGEAKTPR